MSGRPRASRPADQPRCKCGLLATFPEHDFEIQRVRVALEGSMGRRRALEAELTDARRALADIARTLGYKDPPDLFVIADTVRSVTEAVRGFLVGHHAGRPADAGGCPNCKGGLHLLGDGK